MNMKQIRGVVRGLAGSMEERTGKLIGNWGMQRQGMTIRISAKSERLAGDAIATIKAALRR